MAALRRMGWARKPTPDFYIRKGRDDKLTGRDLEAKLTKSL